MCGRYALALRAAQVRQMLEDDNMPVYEAPPDPDDGDDDDDDGRSGGGGGGGGGGGSGGADDVAPRPRQSYNFAPGYHGIVYRADVPDWGAGPRRHRPRSHPHPRGAGGDGDGDAGDDDGDDDDDDDNDGDAGSSKKEEVRYKLQAMKWGLVPFWTKRGKSSGYGSMMKTINCRDDSLAQGGGMWASMKARKRCVVVAQGFYEWLRKGGSEKVPHFVKRRDGRLMCFAGLWDVVLYGGDEEQRKQYTYTIITTDSNKQLRFLHDRMPVILENGSDELRTWLDPERHEWSKELQSLLKPFDGELDVYPVSKDVGKVGNNSPSFIIPIDSKENKNNIANFFAKGASTTTAKKEEKPPLSSNSSLSMKKEEGRSEHEEEEDKILKEHQPEVEVKKEEGFVVAEDEKNKNKKTLKASQSTNFTTSSVKREAEEDDDDDDDNNAAEEDPPKKKNKTEHTTMKTTSSSPVKGGGVGGGKRPKISATSNGTKSPIKKTKEPGTQKITKFFANSS